jgi:hypothetical protein
MVLFYDTGEILPNGAVVTPRRPTDRRAVVGVVRN